MALTYQDANILLLSEIQDCLVFFEMGHAAKIIEKIDVCFLEHPSNDPSDDDKCSKYWISSLLSYS